jgi:hypothetical protein
MSDALWVEQLSTLIFVLIVWFGVFESNKASAACGSYGGPVQFEDSTKSGGSNIFNTILIVNISGAIETDLVVANRNLIGSSNA